MTNLAAIEFLRSAEGELHLREADGLDLEGTALLTALTHLRRRLDADRAAAVLEQVGLRRRAASKFSRAGKMLFTPDGLEQASGEVVATHSASRYREFSLVADCCCGVGGDTIALARQTAVEGYDIDPARLACAEHNLAAYGLAGRVSLRQLDMRDLDLSRRPPLEAIFFDPSRRVDGHRIYSLADYHPPVSLVDRWLPQVGAIGVKVAPGVQRDEIRWDCELEFVAEGPDLKEGLLWFGPLATTSRRATILPENAFLLCSQAPAPGEADPAGWLFDPSPAVTRAGLVWELAAILGARQLDANLAYLSGPRPVSTPLARNFPIETWMPFNLKRLKEHLRTIGAGRVEVRRRGAPIDPAVLERRLRQNGPETRLIFLTRLRGRMIAIVCREPSATDLEQNNLGLGR